MRGIDLEEETGSYRLAVSPEVPDDGLTSEGRPRALRFKKHGRARDVIDKPNLDELRAEINLDEHRLPLHNLLGQLQTDPDLGLTPEQAHEILLREGPNLLTMTKASSGCGRFLRHIFGGFCLLLWLLSFLCFLAFLLNLRFLGLPNDNLIYGVLFLMFALIKGTISYCQELQSSKLMNSFNSLPAQSITVIRNGQKYNLPPEEIVVGDLVEIRGGDVIPADMRIISSQGCKVDNSNLTGESEPQLRNYEHTSDNFLETQNLVFFSTHCVEGVARGLVIYTGDRTVMGRIAALSIDLESSEPPLTREIDGFIRAVTSRAIVWGLIFFIVAFFTGFLWIDSVIFFIGFVAAIVPEGLLIIATVSLTLTAKRMASRNCLIKNLEAIETLGTSSIILCDKTGTLTQNRMVVAHLQFDNQIVEADTTEDQRGEQFDKKAPGWKTLSRCAMLCSRAEFKANQELVPITKRETTGDSSETAILRFLELSVNDVSSFRARYPKVCEIPFSTQDRIRITVHETSDTNIGHHIICMKGAPENILDRCRTIYINGKEKILSQDLKDQTLDAIDQLGNYGERVMGFCDLILPKDKYPIGYQFDPDLMNFPTKDLRFLGLISMIDPPRAAVPDAISNCRNAGIRVMMFTGDHPSTAHAIAKTVGIISGNNETVEDIARRLSIRVEEVDSRWAKAVVVEGHQLKQMTNQEIESLLESYEEIVFARASPQQKLAIVEVCQKLGHVVAVTGDGVNDAPALKRADVAIVPGIAGSDVSKQVADVILLDDNFATIARGVEEGRLVFENLRKSIAYALTSNAPEIFAFLLYVVLQLPLPLGLIGVILVDMITDIFPAISLAFEEPEPGVMRQKPRDPKTEELISADMLSKAYLQIGAIQAAAGLFSYFVIMYQSGWWFTNLVGIRRQWDSPSINDLRDSYNQDWTYQQRKTLEFTCHSGFFAAIVLTQWANLLICKTRKNSIFVQRNQNRVVHFALLVETLLAIVLIYTPGLNSTLHLGPLFIRYWLIPLPFSIAIFVYDELRKAVIRRRNTETTK